jgi:lipopolysaccharide assembly protein A
VVPTEPVDSTIAERTISLLHPDTDSTPAPSPDAEPVDAAPVPPSEASAGQGNPAPSSSQPRQRVRGTRTGRVWVGVCAAALITVALIIFMIQNTHTVQVTFLGMTGSTSLALMPLIAAVGGILFTLVLGSARILQLRHSVRKRR